MSTADELEKLAHLRDQGVLSDTEFHVQKARLLGEASENPIGAAPPPMNPYPPSGAPPYPPPYVQASSGTNGMAIASLVLGIVWVWGVGSVLALIFGYISRRQIRATGGRQGGNGMAMAGIVLGWIGVGGLILFIVLAVVAANNNPYGNVGALLR